MEVRVYVGLSVYDVVECWVNFIVVGFEVVVGFVFFKDFFVGFDVIFGLCGCGYCD